MIWPLSTIGSHGLCSPFINTLLQRGVCGQTNVVTASAVLSAQKTTEAVGGLYFAHNTPLKQGVNEIQMAAMRKSCAYQ
jgi:hypothetical protein